MKALLVPALEADGPVKLLLQVVEPSPAPDGAPSTKGAASERDAANRDADGDVEMATAERLASGQAASTSGRAAVPGGGRALSLHRHCPLRNSLSTCTSSYESSVPDDDSWSYKMQQTDPALPA